MSDISAICVFCGSRTGSDPAYENAARVLGRMMAERGIRLVYGGGHVGLMGVVADAVLDAGGQAIGVIPDFLKRREVGRDDLTDLIVTDSMHSRKQRMFELADAFVALPGGLGTLDETIEVATWKQLGLHAKPIVILDAAGYWGALSALLASVVKGGFAYGDIQTLWSVVETPEQVFDAIDAAARPGPKAASARL
ncbi:TIGR00730 family Rossman fold protein [Thalassospiraceae bacterium LMO-SO8]|nr:TIGR00730 family Rossman fold protein [Alphaproteobacteria bacterium LMO-S08]WND76222.1 TIGR00730 family Rossman fold protein [Thalassospiraceae bacterium LMO-SO8]